MRQEIIGWAEELHVLLSPLDDAPVDCDGVTYAVSFVLTEAGIPHHCYKGYVTHPETGDVIVPHLWVELDGDIVVDFRLRMWLGDRDSIPHGVFSRTTQDIEFHGVRQRRNSTINRELLRDMTDGTIDQVVIAQDFVNEYMAFKAG